uniref:Fibrous sheath-interacting protein 1 n=1 Tax=Syphacia muris TaxID=451379 RepID=A0A0N5AZE4_9BILA
MTCAFHNLKSNRTGKSDCLSPNVDAEYVLPGTIISSEPLRPSNATDLKNKEIEERLAALRDNDSDKQKVMSVNEIEERLARLRGVSVKEIRSPSVLLTGKRKEETAENLIEKAKAEANIEKKWESEALCNDDDFADLLSADDAESKSDNNVDMLFGDGTLRNLKELQETIASINPYSKDGKSLSQKQDEMNNEMKALLKLTKQNSLKAEKVTEEMSKFWDSNLERVPQDVDIVDEDVEVDEADLKKIIAEAEEAVNKEKEVLKQTKKPKRGFLSRLFHSND